MNGAGRRISRIALRRRLVAGFVATMLVLLTAAGAFVYWRVQFALDRSLNRDLDRASDELTPLVTESGRLPADQATLARVDGFQVLDATGRVLDHDTKLGARPVLRPAVVQRALRSPVRQDTGDFLPAARRPLRLYAAPVRTFGASHPLILVVAVRRAGRDEALRELLLQLSAAGAATLVLTALVGDRLARAALRPVETYRRRATEIAGGATRLRLDVPTDRDDEITRLGHTLNGMLDALSEAMERERRFINDASHELRTPLTLVTSRVQLMLRRPRTVEQHEAALAEITEDLTRLTRMADDLLEQGTAPSVSTDGQPHDLAAVARKVVDARLTLAPSGTMYGTAGALSIEAVGPVPIAIDVVRLERVLDNLLDNAALHGAPPVTVTVDEVDGWARLTVADCGEGMPAELLTTATERFARSPAARNRPGSGLGLSLAATMVTAAGGQLRLCFAGNHHVEGASAPVRCSHDSRMTMTVLLPVARTRPPD
ncbi:MAG: ATP-binding protein [Nocardioidaceae bacterium]